MIEQQGRVVAIDAGYAWVQTARATACGSCVSKQGCGTANLARLFGDRGATVRVTNRPELRVGDEVILGIRENALLRGAAWMYGVPLAAFVVGGVAGESFAGALSMTSETAPVLMAFVGLACGLWFARWWARRQPAQGDFQPMVLRAVAHPPASSHSVTCVQSDWRRG